MPHDFQAYDSMTTSSTAALARIRHAIDTHIAAGGSLAGLQDITIV